MSVKTYKVVLIKHPNCERQFIFQVPASMDLTAGNYVLCSTNTSELPQVGRCCTPSFMILEPQLKEFYKVQPHQLMPVVGILQPKMYAFESDGDGT